jgi:3-methyladenine DNA glycosylase/8-oxoguanine DNA glycosylase
MKFKLPAKQPFSLNAVLYSHGWASLAPYSLTSDGEGLLYVFRLTSGRGLQVQINPAADGVSVELEEQLKEEERSVIKRNVTWMLGLDQEFTEFYKLAKQEPKLKHIVKKAQGRLLRSPTLFEDTVKTILTTNTAWNGTIRMAQKLVDQFGTELKNDPGKRAFPSPGQIAASDESTLRNETRLGYRSPYILDLAQKITSGDLNLEQFKSEDLPTEHLRKRLLAIKGVGNYAAANLLMLLGHYSYLAIDSWALKMVSHEWYRGEQIGPSEVEQSFERWGKWKGLAYWLWDWSYESS